MRPLHLELEIAYRDAAGTTSRRRLTVKQFALGPEEGEARLAAHCSLSGSFLEFPLAAIEACVDLGSGDPVDDLPAHLLACFARSREGRLEQLERHLADPLAVLLTIARADRLLQAREQELIAAYLEPRQPVNQGVEPLTGVEIARRLPWLALPEPERFSAAVEALAAAPAAEREALLATCLAVADVRLAREGDEQEVLDQLQARWFPPG
jgi:hypothetical protein